MTLVASNLSVAVAGETFLEDVSFTLQPGRIYVVIGRTGAGKTSLMRAIAGLLPLDEGTVEFDGEDFTYTPIWERDCAIVYQQFINYPNRTVRKNIELPLKKQGLKGPELDERVDFYLNKVGLFEFADRKPSQLSGGQQQRVALARSLARKSRILMLDEPLMNLDFKLREQLRADFVELFTAETKSVTLYATTEIAEAMALGHEIMVMHEGRIIQHGIPEEVYERPKNKLVAQILSDPPMSVFPGRISGKDLVLTETLTVPVPSHLRHLGDGDYEFGIRAERISLERGGGAGAKGVVDFVEVSGSETILYVESPLGEVVVQIEGIHDYYAGEEVNLNLDTSGFMAFDANGDFIVSPATEVR